MHNLATRMIINVLGIPAILLMVKIGGIPFLLFFMVIAAVSQVELYLLIAEKGQRPALFLATLLGALWMLTVFFIPQYAFPVLIGMVTIILLAGLFRPIQGASVNLATTLLGVFYPPILLSTLFLIRSNTHDGRQILFMLFASIWICDSLAYVFGKWLGRRKIAPHISPHKTVAGCVGGLAGAVVTVLIFWYLGWQPDFMSFNQVIIFGILTGVLGQAGDFVESIFKRDAGVKDSSRLLLGHGGMLDRFDSFFIGAPVVYLYITWLLR